MPFPGESKNRQVAFLRGHELYLFGGNRSTGQHDFGPDDFTREGWVLNLATFKWSGAAEYPAERQSMRGVLQAEGDHGFTVGGFGTGGRGALEGEAGTFAEAFAYSFEGNAWNTQMFEDIPPRSQFLLAKRDGGLWIFGGQYTDENATSEGGTVYTTEVFRSEAVAGSEKGPIRFSDAGVSLPFGRCAFAGATLGDQVYFVGGMREDFELLEVCHRFDFETQEFSVMPSPNAPRLGAKLVPLDGKLYLIGGYTRGEHDRLTPERSIEFFDPASQTWSLHSAALPDDNRHIHAFAYQGRLMVFTTHFEGESKARVTLIEPDHGAGSGV